MQFAPIVNIMLPDLWFINLFPSTDIRYNLGDMKDGDTGRWFVPANFMIGKMLDKDTVTSLEIGIPIIDLLGAAWYAVYAQIPITTALLTTALPFLPGDIIKAVGAVLVYLPLRKALRQFSK